MRRLGVLVILAAFGAVAGMVATETVGDPEQSRQAALQSLKRVLLWLADTMGPMTAAGLVMAAGIALGAIFWRATRR